MFFTAVGVFILTGLIEINAFFVLFKSLKNKGKSLINKTNKT